MERRGFSLTDQQPRLSDNTRRRADILFLEFPTSSELSQRKAGIQRWSDEKTHSHQP